MTSTFLSDFLLHWLWCWECPHGKELGWAPDQWQAKNLTFIFVEQHTRKQPYESAWEQVLPWLSLEWDLNAGKHIYHGLCEEWAGVPKEAYSKPWPENTLRPENVLLGVTKSYIICYVAICRQHNHAKFLQLCLFATQWTLAHQASLSMGFSRQEYWSGLPFLPPGYLHNPEIEPTALKPPALAGGFFTTSATWEVSGNTISRFYFLLASLKINYHRDNS